MNEREILREYRIRVRARPIETDDIDTDLVERLPTITVEEFDGREPRITKDLRAAVAEFGREAYVEDVLIEEQEVDE